MKRHSDSCGRTLSLISLKNCTYYTMTIKKLYKIIHITWHATMFVSCLNAWNAAKLIPVLQMHSEKDHEFLFQILWIQASASNASPPYASRISLKAWHLSVVLRLCGVSVFIHYATQIHRFVDGSEVMHKASIINSLKHELAMTVKIRFYRLQKGTTSVLRVAAQQWCVFLCQLVQFAVQLTALWTAPPQASSLKYFKKCSEIVTFVLFL